jgi:predicted nucleotidyltransferase
MKLDKNLPRTRTVQGIQRKEVGAIYLSGSQVKGEARKGSDVDLGILFAKFKKKSLLSFPQVTYSSVLSESLGKKVEVIDLGETRIDFAHRVITEGKLLLSNNDKERIKFEEKILDLYFDLKPGLDEYYKNLSQIARKGELHVRYL